jgi:hypothetical protein
MFSGPVLVTQHRDHHVGIAQYLYPRYGLRPQRTHPEIYERPPITVHMLQIDMSTLSVSIVVIVLDGVGNGQLRLPLLLTHNMEHNPINYFCLQRSPGFRDKMACGCRTNTLIRLNRGSSAYFEIEGGYGLRVPFIRPRNLLSASNISV